MPDVTYRLAQETDLPGIAAVFLAAFPDSVRHYVGRTPPPAAVIDLFALCLRAEPDAFRVAVLDGRIAGYIFAPASLARVARIARAELPRLAWRWLSGQYRLGLRPVWVAVRNALGFLHDLRRRELAVAARVLSVAVDPTAQGHGIGSALLRQGIEALRARGIGRIRLEVRPGNAPAVHLYAKLGFHPRGRTRDTQGEWLIMIQEGADDLPR